MAPSRASVRQPFALFMQKAIIIAHALKKQDGSPPAQSFLRPGLQHVAHDRFQIFTSADRPVLETCQEWYSIESDLKPGLVLRQTKESNNSNSSMRHRMDLRISAAKKSHFKADGAILFRHARTRESREESQFFTRRDPGRRP